MPREIDTVFNYQKEVKYIYLAVLEGYMDDKIVIMVV